MSQIAKDFGVSEFCLHRWLSLADIDDGVRPGVTSSDAGELREAKKRVRLLEQENEILRRAAAFFARDLTALAQRGQNPDDYTTYLDVFAHGMPPHGGFALGLERWVARLVGADTHSVVPAGRKNMVLSIVATFIGFCQGFPCEANSV